MLEFHDTKDPRTEGRVARTQPPHPIRDDERRGAER